MQADACLIPEQQAAMVEAGIAFFDQLRRLKAQRNAALQDMLQVSRLLIVCCLASFKQRSEALAGTYALLSVRCRNLSIVQVVHKTERGTSIAQQSWQLAAQMSRFQSLVDVMAALRNAELQALADASAVFFSEVSMCSTSRLNLGCLLEGMCVTCVKGLQRLI